MKSIAKNRQLRNTIHYIQQADDFEITEIVKAIVHRYSEVFPDWEVMFLSLPKEPAQRSQRLDLMLHQLKNHSL